MKKSWVIVGVFISFIACKEKVPFEKYEDKKVEEHIFIGEKGKELLNHLKGTYQVVNSYSYIEARKLIYGVIDLDEDNILRTIYTDYAISINPYGNVIGEAYDQGVNCEHLYPQSKGAKQLPMRSDMHHLFPCKANINSARRNFPLVEVADKKTDQWFYQSSISNRIPAQNKDWYSESDRYAFEPREEVKGDVARAIMYFYVVYNGTADTSFFNKMKKDLIRWNSQDPVSEKEWNRNQDIKYYQGNDNPFVLDESLPKRLWK